MEKIKFESYTRLNGHNEFAEYLNTLSKKDRAKMLVCIAKVEKYGLATAIQQKWVKIIDSDIYELRERMAKKRMRALYFHDVGGVYQITHGFTKKTKKTPPREIKHAHEIMNEFYKQRKDENNE